ncbi:MAG: glycosyltransferase [bacterium]|nr:glycosyltransferase [bacterium]
MSFWQFLQKIAQENGDRIGYLVDAPSRFSIDSLKKILAEQTLFATHPSIASVLASFSPAKTKVFLLWSIPRSARNRLLLRIILKGFTHIITNDSITAGELSTKLGLSESKVRFMPYGVDTKFFKNTEKQKSQFDFIVPGDAYRDENLVCQLLEKSNCSILRLTNNRSVANQYEALESRYPERLTLMYRVAHDRLPQSYSSAKFCLLPITKSTEPAGLTCLLESMACGIPCLTNAAKTSRDYLIHGKNGFVFDSLGDILQIYSEVVEREYLTLAKNCRSIAEKYYDWSVLESSWNYAIYNSGRRQCQ